VDWRQSDLLGEASLVIALAPPWWRRGKVIGLAILGLASVVYGFYLWRAASYRRRHRQLNTVTDRCTRELSDKNLALQQASQEREALMRQLEYRASHDVLTALPNRRKAERVLQQGFDEAHAGGAALALALMDIDHFKRINDCERINDDGHEVGDAVLSAIGQALSEQDQARCFAARLRWRRIPAGGHRAGCGTGARAVRAHATALGRHPGRCARHARALYRQHGHGDERRSAKPTRTAGVSRSSSV